MIEMGPKAHNEVVWVWRRACVPPSLSLSPLHLTASRSSLSLTTSWIHMWYGIHMAFSWTNRAQTKPCVYQEPGERSSVLTRHWVRLLSVKESLVEAWVNSLASGQTTGREHNPTHQQKIGLKIYPPSRTRPTFPKRQFLPSGSFHKPLILIHQRADRMKTTITEN